MPAADAPSPIRFGGFRFDEVSGELWRDGEEGPATTRLAPQPAKLLSHLIARRPHLLGRDEIRRLLWQDSEIEFEQGLHTCIRQIRAALGDSATDPRFIETIPRRGYRFLATVEEAEVEEEAAPEAEMETPRSATPEAVPGEAAAGAGAGPGPAGDHRGLGTRLAIALGLGLALVTAALWLAAGTSTGARTEAQTGAQTGAQTRAQIGAVRIAVMPFEPTKAPSALVAGNDLAESLVEILVERRPALEVIGPTTTRRYAGRPTGLGELIAELEIDYVINGRETSGEAGPRLLVEIIRGTDGAHLWARYLGELPAGREPAGEIAQAVAATVR